MSSVILHTADWQLGKTFAFVADESKRNRLRQERIEVIGRIGQLAKETGASMILVAGDLFDTPHVTKGTVSAACAAIGAIGLPVVAIPGNHDHGGPGSIWEQEFFLREQQALAPNLRVLLKPEPLVLDQAVIFPAPLLRRHESGDVTAWIRAALQAGEFPQDRPRIALAHGSVEGFGSPRSDDEEGDSFPNMIDVEKLAMPELDYIALGDWHGVKQVAAKAWYSGTPETDRFPKGESNRPGYILKVTASRGGAPVVEEVVSGRFAWEEAAFRFSEDSHLEIFAAELDGKIGSRAGDCLLKLALEGTLGYEASARLAKMLESWESRLLRLKLDQQVSIAPTEDEITAMTDPAGDPLVAAVAGKLAEEMKAGGEEGEIARLALWELHGTLSAARV